MYCILYRISLILTGFYGNWDNLVVTNQKQIVSDAVAAFEIIWNHPNAVKINWLTEGKKFINFPENWLTAWPVEVVSCQCHLPWKHMWSSVDQVPNAKEDNGKSP